MQQSLKRTRVLVAKIGKMLDLIAQTDDISSAERDLILSYFNDAQRFFKEDVALDEPRISAPLPTIIPSTLTPPNPPAEITVEKVIEKGQETFSVIAGTLAETVAKVVEQATHKLEENIKPPKSSGIEAQNKNTWGDLMQSAERFLGNDSLKTAEKEPAQTVEETSYEEVVYEEVKTQVSVEQIRSKEAEQGSKKTTGREDTPLEDDIVPYKEPVSPPPVLKKMPIVSLHSNDDDDAPTANGMSIEELFEINTSENYGSIKPIKDLRVAFGINERLFNINELFAKNGVQYDLSLNAINELTSFAEAKEYILKHIIEQYAWNTPQKQKKAQGFIRHLWRRFL